MAVTQQQWFNRLQSWVPSWFFELSGVNYAHFWALAKLLAQEELIAEKKLNDTYITFAEGAYLDHKGEEWGVFRLFGESDADYRVRIRKSIARSGVDKISIQELVTSLTGPLSLVQEWHDSHNFANSGAYANIGHLMLEEEYNQFYVFIDRIENLFPPSSFMNLDAFLDTRSFLVDNEFNWDVPSGEGEANFEAIWQAIQDAKAAGVRFTLTERQNLIA